MQNMNPENMIPEKKRFSVVARTKSLTNAVRGIGIVLRTQHNMWIHMVAMTLVVALGVHLHINQVEWFMLIFAISAVFITESINTAIEIDIDLTSPEYHPFARDTKDVAAGAVLLAVFCAIVVGAIIFLPKLVF